MVEKGILTLKYNINIPVTTLIILISCDNFRDNIYEIYFTHDQILLN